MPQQQSRISLLWQELKRRRVIHMITVYASASFVIIELAGNLTEPLNLPPSLSTIVIILLAVGFIPAIILSWIFDLSSGTLKRTEPMEQLKDEDEKAQVPNAWKIATIISFLVIIGLVVFNIVSRGDVLKPGMIKSLAVLPFDNYTGDDQLDNVAAGLHTSLIGDIGKLGALNVRGKTSSSIYRNSKKSAVEIAKELKVDALVEPAVLCYGDSVCLQIKLITLYPEERQHFVKEYKVDKSEILNFFNKVTKEIAEEMLVEITPEQERMLSKTRTVDREAMDDYLVGLSFLEDFSKEGLFNAIEKLNSAIEKDPDWAPLYAGLAKAWLVIAQAGYVSPSLAYQNVYKNLDKAFELDLDLSNSYFISGMSAYLHEWNWDKGEKELLKALAINPNDAMSRIYYAQLLAILQRPEEASTQGQLAIDLDPSNPLLQVLYSALLVGVDDCETALAHLEKVVAVEPGNVMANNVIELAAFRCGDYSRAFEAAKHILGLLLDEDTFKKIERIYEEQGFTVAYLEIARQMDAYAENGLISPIEPAVRYIYADMPDKAMDWLEKGFELRDPNMPYIATGVYNLDPLFSNPRFIDIVEKMNLPFSNN
jgi:TolB-like protein